VEVSPRESLDARMDGESSGRGAVSSAPNRLEEARTEPRGTTGGAVRPFVSAKNSRLGQSFTNGLVYSLDQRKLVIVHAIDNPRKHLREAERMFKHGPYSTITFSR
jgi:hypothetical protein